MTDDTRRPVMGGFDRELRAARQEMARREVAFDTRLAIASACLIVFGMAAYFGFMVWYGAP